MNSVLGDSPPISRTPFSTPSGTSSTTCLPTDVMRPGRPTSFPRTLLL
jgi:hypothetical protein